MQEREPTREEVQIGRATLVVAEARVKFNEALDSFLEAKTPRDRKRGYSRAQDTLDTLWTVVDALDTLLEKAGR